MIAPTCGLTDFLGQESLSRRTLLLSAATGMALAMSHNSGVRAQDATARVRFVNAKSQSTPVDISIDGSVVAQNLGFGETSKILEAPAAAFLTAATPTGDDAILKKVRADFDLTAGFAYEIAVLDDSMLRVGVLLTPIEENSARLRAIHASPDTGKVSLGIDEGDQLFEELQFKDATPYLDLPEGAFDFEILEAPNTPGLATALGSKLTGRKAHHLYFIGRESDQSLRLVMTNWWADRGSPQEVVPLTEPEMEYLTIMEAVRSMVERSMLVLHGLLDETFLDGYQMGDLANVLLSWVVAETSIQVLEVPERFRDLHDAFARAVEPMAKLAREIAGAEATLTVSGDGYALTARIDQLAFEVSNSFVSSEMTWSPSDLSVLLQGFTQSVLVPPAGVGADDADTGQETFLRLLLKPVLDAVSLFEEATVALELARQEAGLAPA